MHRSRASYSASSPTRLGVLSPARARSLALVLPCALLLALLGSCQGVRNLTDPTLTLRTKGGSELGVSTEYGIVFLGHYAQSGPVEVTAWYGDGPNIEKTVIEPVGHGIYTAETEIALPQIPLSFVDPLPGSELLIIGRKDGKEWSEFVTVAADPHVLGIITNVPDRLRDAPDQIGAGVYIVPDDNENERRLVGLVSGRITLETSGKQYLTVVGPTDLWRLVSHRREARVKRRWVYREDIM